VPASPAPSAPARPAAPAPARALPPATPAARPAPAARERAPQGVWGNLLAELAKTHAEAAEVLKRRGTLAETTGSRATIQLQRLLEPERALLADSALRATLEALLARSLARPVQLVLDDPATRAAGSSDPFTREVAELFGGLIEDNA
jgi:hypothetical protein